MSSDSTKNIVVLDSTPTDHIGRLGKLLTTGQLDLVFDASKHRIKRSANWNINVANTTTSDISFELWFSTSNVPQAIDCVEPGVVVKGKTVFLRSGFLLNLNEKIFIRSSAPGLAVRVEGLIDAGV